MVRATALVFVTALLAGCASTPTRKEVFEKKSESVKISRLDDRARERLARYIGARIVRVSVGERWGTGVLVSEDLVLTSTSLLGDDPSDIEIVMPGDPVDHEARVAWRAQYMEEKGFNVAILRSTVTLTAIPKAVSATAGVTPTALPWADIAPETPRIFDRVFVAAHFAREDARPMMASGEVLGVESFLPGGGLGPNCARVAASAPSVACDTGGGVFDAAGRLVGIVAAAENPGFGLVRFTWVPAWRLRGLIARCMAESRGRPLPPIEIQVNHVDEKDKSK